jgi:hypothetical protein
VSTLDYRVTRRVGRRFGWLFALTVACSGAGKGPPGPSWAGDSDHDGIKDSDDQCKDQPEDWDGFKDEDGCPDPDNDDDGIPDATDQCPFAKGDGDPSGCPGVTAARAMAGKKPSELDKDKDGILDDIDKCPNDPEDYDGFQDNDGCPDPDNDGDGIPDAQDKCPGTDQTADAGTNTKEDGRPPNPTDGCPAFDTDKDGVADWEDQCKLEPGPPSTHGCPDKDGDGIPDKDDQCKTEPGPANTHGCPDKDGDGIADKDDKCPNLREDGMSKPCISIKVYDAADTFKKHPTEVRHCAVPTDGCPGADADGDGVPNDIDNYPEDKNNH